MLATFTPDPTPADEGGAPLSTHVTQSEADRVPNGVQISNEVSAEPQAKANDPTANAASAVGPVPVEATTTSLPLQDGREKMELKKPT